MELYREILIEALAKEKMQITFPNLQITAEQLVEMECYKALQKSKPSSRMKALKMRSVLGELKES